MSRENFISVPFTTGNETIYNYINAADIRAVWYDSVSNSTAIYPQGVSANGNMVDNLSANFIGQFSYISLTNYPLTTPSTNCYITVDSINSFIQNFDDEGNPLYTTVVPSSFGYMWVVETPDQIMQLIQNNIQKDQAKLAAKAGMFKEAPRPRLAETLEETANDLCRPCNII